MTKKISRENWMLLSKKNIMWLLLYYVVLFVVSLFATCFIFWYFAEIVEGIQISKLIIICSIPNALLGACIYYIRKVYKACIQNTISEPSDDFKSSIRVVGANVYFCIRPFISIALAVIISFGIYFGVFTFTVDPNIIQNNFAIICTVLSFYIGFNNGVIIKNLDDKENEFLKSFIWRNKNEHNG